jgi:hypothetical protein
MFVEWVMFGTVLFWLIVTGISLLAVLCLHAKYEGPLVLLGGLFLLVWFLAGDMKQTVSGITLDALWYAGAYVAIGLVWCWPKWILLLNKCRIAYLDELVDFRHAHSIPANEPLPKKLWESWRNQIGHEDVFCEIGLKFDTETGKVVPPTAYQNKAAITSWAILWPWSMLESLLGDVFKQIVDFVCRLYRRTFDAISRWMFRGL